MADRVLRVMTDDGAFRIIAVVARDTATDIAASQNVSGPVAQRLADLVTGAILIRETCAPNTRYQVSLRDQSGGSLVADARPDGTNRGLHSPGVEAAVDLDQASTLHVSSSRANGSMHQSTVAVPADSSIADALMTFLQTSAQIVATMAVASTQTAGGLLSCGFVVQLLPEAERPALESMTQQLESVDALAKVLTMSSPTPEDVLALVAAGHPHSFLADCSLSYSCGCSRDRVLVTLAGLPNADIASLISDAAPIEVSCDGCNQVYQFSRAEIAGTQLGNNPAGTS